MYGRFLVECKKLAAVVVQPHRAEKVCQIVLSFKQQFQFKIVESVLQTDSYLKIIICPRNLSEPFFMWKRKSLGLLVLVGILKFEVEVKSKNYSSFYIRGLESFLVVTCC